MNQVKTATGLILILTVLSTVAAIGTGAPPVLVAMHGAGVGAMTLSALLEWWGIW